MAEKSKEVLALELRQIIQADRMACDIIESARDVGKSIERQTEKQKAALLAEAEAARADMEKQVWAEEEKTLAKQMALINDEFGGYQKALQTGINHNREKWISDIVARITAVGHKDAPAAQEVQSHHA